MLRFFFYFLIFSFLLIVIGTSGVYWYIAPQLPSVEKLRFVQLQTPLRIFTVEGKLIAEFGEKRRNPVDINEVPEQLKLAFIASEDERFRTHPGVDWMAITRAIVKLAETRQKKQGGSTITMQVARNFFLSPEKKYERKLKEIVLALKIERELSKDEILELYLNKIFLGHRAYGVGAAARVYYGVSIKDLTLAQVAMIAGLPKAPSRDNPVTNPQRALERRAYVLARMRKLAYIDETAFRTANAAPISAKLHGPQVEARAPYVAEMVRRYMLEHYGDAAKTSGYRVHTTISKRLQHAGRSALRKALRDYDRRHGYRGAEHHIELGEVDDLEQWQTVLDSYQDWGGLQAAIVISVNEKDIEVFASKHEKLTIPWRGLKWARAYISHDARKAAPKSADNIVKRGDIVRIESVTPKVSENDPRHSEGHKKGDKDAEPDPPYWRLAQIPAVEGALVSIDAQSGAIQALVGGFDFNKSNFNRVVQARRQPGSNFKPFIYSAALDAGYTAASFINDAPIVFDAPGLNSAWRPENYSGKYYGPTRIREALTKSRNLVSIRLLKAIGVQTALDYAQRFGFERSRLPKNLSLALGSGELVPLDVVRGYAVFANGGYRVDPYFVKRVEAEDGRLIWRATPPTVCPKCEDLEFDEDGEPLDLETLVELGSDAPIRPATRVVEAQNAWIINSILKNVIRSGTGVRARQLDRHDLGGKTGTTNEQKDAWFSGFNNKIVTTVWVGFDQVAPLGRRETGARAALPMWIDYMREALQGTPEAQLERPPGLVSVFIDPKTGLPTDSNNPAGIFESFREQYVPLRQPSLSGEENHGIPGGLF